MLTPPALSSPYDDPHYQPQADIQGSEARAYEAKIFEGIRRAMLPGSRTSVIKLEAVESAASDPTPKASSSTQIRGTPASASRGERGYGSPAFNVPANHPP
jgi:hypothetical protein